MKNDKKEKKSRKESFYADGENNNNNNNNNDADQDEAQVRKMTKQPKSLLIFKVMTFFFFHTHFCDTSLHYCTDTSLCVWIL